MSETVVEIHDLVKEYVGRKGNHLALSGVDLTVPAGTVTAVLGPNGAGKTTAVRIIATLAAPTSGSVTVAGIDVTVDPRAVRGLIGLSGQYAAVDGRLTGYENLRMLGRLYGLGGSGARARAKELLRMFQLEDAAGRASSTYSGGMRRRLDLAGALVARPPLVILDEPTTGLDPRSRGELWGVVENLTKDGTAVLLTTQYLDEAERLADDVVVFDKGRVVATGTPTELKSRLRVPTAHVQVLDPANLRVAYELLARMNFRTHPDTARQGWFTADAPYGSRSLMLILSRLHGTGIDVNDAHVSSPNLDDVFFDLTGDEAPEVATATPLDVAVVKGAARQRFGKKLQ
ncbi:ABC transporter ATP-binding protein [Actinomycetes bacterium M1A6_2h]